MIQPRVRPSSIVANRMLCLNIACVGRAVGQLKNKIGRSGLGRLGSYMHSPPMSAYGQG